jgi:hypothetical protein
MSSKIINLGKSFWRAVLALALLGSQADVSHAAPLPPGGVIFPVSPEPDPLGATLLDQIIVPFVSTSFSGNLISSVYNGDVTSPFGPTALTFTYEVVITNGPDAMTGISVGPFTGFQTDVSFQLPSSIGPGVPPFIISRNLTGSQAVNFGFPGNNVPPGLNSLLLVVQTDDQLPVFGLGSATISDDVGIIVPALAPVPEPASVGCFLLGFGAMIFARRFRQK